MAAKAHNEFGLFMTIVVIVPIWAIDAAVSQSDEPKHYGMNGSGELCGWRG